MCGIIGMVGNSDAVPFLLSGLQRMEYRGYDSAGIAVYTGDDFLRRRAKGKISALQNVVKDAPLSGCGGIGHIRWATHGAPTEANAHPHASADVVVVHNGIIENWQELKAELLTAGCIFSSETDTEVVAHLIQGYLDKGLEAKEAFAQSVKRLQGAYALAVMIKSTPEIIYVARLGSPLVIGVGDGEMYVGSDPLSLAQATDKVMFLEEGDWGIVTIHGTEIYNGQNQKVTREVSHTGLTAEKIDKGGFEHFMLKEVYEQPSVLAGLIEQYIDVENKQVKELELSLDANTISRMTFTACGTAFHAALLGRYYMETLARIAVDLDVASEYRYRDLVQPKDGVFITFSQSGETADTLAALRRAKAEGQHVITIVNVLSSTMARESDDILATMAGAEIGVASTKAYTAQCFVVLCLALWLGRKRGVLSAAKEKEIVEAILELPRLYNLVLEQEKEIEHIGKAIAPASDVLFLGRGRCYPIALESALKLKEISYIHAEGYASGEMKHGAIALIDEHVPVVVLAPNDDVLDKSLSNMHEVAARKAQVILVSDAKTAHEQEAIHKVVMPDIHPITSPILYVLPMQFLAYYAAVALGKDVDQPRNLAKSVTVE
ncbi:MAG: glutamine--fructose-6-phosphate transaminase (isomerizing) [Alphaproteobacteria bacterium]